MAGPENAPLPTAHPSVLIAVLAAAGIGVSLMQTLIIPLLPELPKLLNASASDTSWAITATLLTAAVATPVFGRLGDMYGAKPMLIACALLLICGSVLAASTNTLLPLVVGRGLQGLASRSSRWASASCGPACHPKESVAQWVS